MKINESSLLCQQFIPNSCALLETSARKNQSGLFTILISEPQCTHSTKTDILQTGKKTHNGDSDHHFQTRSSQLLSLKKTKQKTKQKKEQKSDSLVRVSRQRLQVPFYSTEINSTSETKVRFKRGATAVPI